MAPTTQPCPKYQYVVTKHGPKILPVDDQPCKDEESPAEYSSGGYLPVKVDDSFKDGRYRVVRKLGWGHFSTVWLAKDINENRHSALKVVKSAGRYAETARDEIKLLSQVAAASPLHPGRVHIVSFLDSFTHQGPESSHVCIVFEPLGENLLALIERNKKKGVPRDFVRLIARQLLQGLQYLHDECDLVHTDIKPENILISIPDVETHISNELTHSPSPSSRRVSVPYPTKSRAGVTIPHNPHRPRRQVQIFESQPLGSPGSRSAGASGYFSSGNAKPGQGESSAGSSQPGSYVSPSQMARFSSGSSNFASGTVASLSSSAPKVPSGLSTSAPRSTASASSKGPAVKASLKKGTSTSSSSSSVSSTLTSSNAGSSSTVSTPPTSLSHSLGSAVAGMMKMSLSGDAKQQLERTGIPVKSSKGKSKLIESELEEAASPNSSWRDLVGSPGSWRDKLTRQLSASYTSSSPISMSPGTTIMKSPRNSTVPVHSRSNSGISISSSWKDPGLAAPAPAVVVSAVALPDGSGSQDYFDLSTVQGDSPGSDGLKTHSQSSSATATITHSTPNETPGPRGQKSSSPGKRFEQPPSSTSALTPLSNTNNKPSLLSRTAPRSVVPKEHSSRRPTPERHSPPSHVSQLTGHMHKHPPPDYPISSDTPSASATIATINASSSTSISSTNARTESKTTSVHAQPDALPSLTLSMTAPKETAAAKAGGSSKPVLAPLDPPSRAFFPPVSIKIADLGNATPSKKHYTEDIQTRQYRAPEAILGRKDWDARADIWSVACVVFELLTAEYLFDPQGQPELFTKDDDHMAQIIELLGDFPMEWKMGGKYSRELFDHTGSLRYIKTLKPWPLKQVMMQKYSFSEPDADAFCAFIEPMLAVPFVSRAKAADMVNHPWLDILDQDVVPGEW